MSNFDPINYSSLFRNGYVYLPQYKSTYTPDDVMSLLGSSPDTYKENSNLHNAYLEEHNILLSLGTALSNASRNNLGIKVDIDDVYKITRVVYATDLNESYLTHFDSHIFTLVTPLIMPPRLESNNGELIIFNKIRKEPSNELSNMVSKLFYKKNNGKEKVEYLMQHANYIEVNFSDMVPILFLGRQSLHCNRPFSSNALYPRVTLLTHFFDPSPLFSVGNLNRFIRNR